MSTIKYKKSKEDREFNEKKLTELCCMFLVKFMPYSSIKKNLVCTNKDMNKIY